MKFLLTLVLLLTATATPAVALTLRDQTTIDRDQVLVGDLFDDAGANAAQPVGTAPAPGAKTTYDVSALTRVARAYGMDWQPTHLDVHCTVTRATTKVTNIQIQEAVREALATTTSEKGKYDIQLDRRTMEINLPASQHVSTVKLIGLSYDPKGYRFNGSLVVELGDGDQPSVTSLSGRAVPMIDVPVVAHNIDSGITIAESDLDYITMTADRVPADTIRSPADLINKETRRGLPMGSTIAERDLRPAQLVKRGALVTLVVDSGMLHITARGRALADAAAGQPVRIMNLQSNKVVDGVVGPNGDVLVTTNS